MTKQQLFKLCTELANNFGIVPQDFLFHLFTIDEEFRNSAWKKAIQEGPDEKFISTRNLFLIGGKNEEKLELSLFDGSLRICHIDAGVSKNSGNGTKLLSAICEFADREGVKITLTTSCDWVGDDNAIRLLNFYSKFDFSSTRISNDDICEELIIDGLDLKRHPKKQA